MVQSSVKMGCGDLLVFGSFLEMICRHPVFYFLHYKKSQRVIKCTLSTRFIMSALMVISNLSLITAGLYWNIKIMQCDLCQNQLFSEQWLVFTLNDLLCGMLSSLKYVTGRFKFLLLLKTTLKSFLYKFLGLLEQVWGEIVSTLHPPFRSSRNEIQAACIIFRNHASCCPMVKI